VNAGLGVVGVPSGLSFTDPQGNITGPAVVTQTLSGPLAGLLGPAPTGFADPTTAANTMAEAVQGIDATPEDVAAAMAAISMSPAVGSVTAGLSPGQAAQHGNEAGIPGQLGAFGHETGPTGSEPSAPGVAGTATGDSSTGGDPSGSTYARGGLVRDRGTRRGLEERITAHEGEFVVTRPAVRRYGLRLLEAINRGEAEVRAPRGGARPRALRESMTR
jgi:hypothetical protein